MHIYICVPRAAKIPCRDMTVVQLIQSLERHVHILSGYEVYNGTNFKKLFFDEYPQLYHMAFHILLITVGLWLNGSMIYI